MEMKHREYNKIIRDKKNKKAKMCEKSHCNRIHSYSIKPMCLLVRMVLELTPV